MEDALCSVTRIIFTASLSNATSRARFVPGPTFERALQQHNATVDAYEQLSLNQIMLLASLHGSN